MDVEFEEVEEGIADEGDGAIELCLNAVAELERRIGLLTGREGDPVEFVFVVFDVFSRLAMREIVSVPTLSLRWRSRSLTSFCSCTRRGWVRHSDMKAVHPRGQRGREARAQGQPLRRERWCWSCAAPLQRRRGSKVAVLVQVRWLSMSFRTR